MVKTQNQITIFFESDSDTAHRFLNIIENIVKKNTDGKLITVSYTDLKINTH